MQSQPGADLGEEQGLVGAQLPSFNVRNFYGSNVNVNVM